MHIASGAEALAAWPAVRAAHLFGSRERFDQFREIAPWRIQVTMRGEAVVLERWRAHLDVLAIAGLWASPSRTPHLLRGVARIARQQGFGRVLSPLVSQEVAAEYEAGGMIRQSTIVAARLTSGTASRHRSIPADVTVRPAHPDDLPEILALDETCFDEFWRYDAERMARHLVEGRTFVAEEGGLVIGYTHSTRVRGSGTIGRLAVSPEARRRGVGAALLADSLGHFERIGIRSVSLCTQEENSASRSLYRTMGFTELTGTLVFLIGPAASGGTSGPAD